MVRESNYIIVVVKHNCTEVVHSIDQKTSGSISLAGKVEGSRPS